jgi:hypothetical protein
VAKFSFRINKKIFNSENCHCVVDLEQWIGFKGAAIGCPVIAVTRTWEVLSYLPGTSYKYKENKRDGYDIAFIFRVED